MQKRLLILSVILALTSVKVCAQEDYLSKTLPVFHDTTQSDSAEVFDKLHYVMTDQVEKYLILTDSLDKNEHSKPGYRIQIYSNSGPSARENAIKEQSKFLTLHQETSSYTKWSYPNWCVRVGDFRTKLEALEFHLAIRELYPASFIISDEIEVEY